MQDIFLVSSVRTAVGTFGGSLSDKTPAELGTLVAKEAIARADIAAEQIGHVVFGQVMPSCPADAYLARVIGIQSQIPQTCPAVTTNRLCGSGLEAILNAAQRMMLGDCEIALAGGVEVMSKAPFFANDMRNGRKLGDSTLIDGLSGALTDPFSKVLMGVTAENVAQKYAISREMQDIYAAESHGRAAHAISEGRFVDQILPVEIKKRRKLSEFSTDEHVREETTAQSLSQLRTIFIPENGTVTAGNASGINDGAAAVILATGDAVRKNNLTPMARLVSYGHSGVDPSFMGVGPVSASQMALERAGLNVGDLDLIESNEAFAAQACAVAQELQLDPEKVNPNGSGIALGHPVGATGAIITTKAVHELARIKQKRALVTMCIGGGQGIAAIFERT